MSATGDPHPMPGRVPTTSLTVDAANRIMLERAQDAAAAILDYAAAVFELGTAHHQAGDDRGCHGYHFGAAQLRAQAAAMAQMVDQLRAGG